MSAPERTILSPRARERTILSWSSGKDSAWALHLLRQDPAIEVVALFTSFSQPANRVAMHAVRRELVDAQAARVGLPLWTVDLPVHCTNEQYEREMEAIWRRARDESVRFVAFGDLFLADIRAYRERQLQNTGLQPLFPVWELPTQALAEDMLEAGVRARITCVDPRKLGRSCAGREFNREFLDTLPPGVDPCGENGEFHTFVYEAPVFSSPIAVESGIVLERDGFVFADIVPRLSVPDVLPGLCGDCVHAAVMQSDRGSQFYRCRLAGRDPSFPRYPRLPVLACRGYAAR